MKFHEFYEDLKRVYLVREPYSFDLYERLNTVGVFSEEMASSITQQLLTAAKYIHSQGIVHRDIKPENIVFVSKNKLFVKLMDFGNSSKIKDWQRMKEVVGTSYYIAPEVLFGEYNQSCDLWSIGVILYIMLTGVPPFDGKTDREIVKNV